MKKKEYNKKRRKEKEDLKKLQLDGNNSSMVKNIIFITLGVVAFIFLMYAFTKIKMGEWNLFTKKNDKFYSAEIQNTKILCGSIFTRKASEYYVLAYNMSADDASIYVSSISRYEGVQSTKLPLYTLDLSNSRNNICLGDNLNIVNDATALKLTSPTLLKITNGMIDTSFTTKDTIKNELLRYVD